jgi:hypothetical protein
MPAKAGIQYSPVPPIYVGAADTGSSAFADDDSNILLKPKLIRKSS